MIECRTNFLFKCLKTFGFKYNFIKWINILYTDINSSVIVNNFISDPIQITRGVRQGCALSPLKLLYVLTLEPFANQIRLNPSIHGIPLPGTNIQSKISMYADDSTATLNDMKSAEIVLNTAKLFGRASGSKLNIFKTKGMFLGKWKNRSDHPFGISWIKNAKLLGRKVGSYLTDDDNWSDIFRKFQRKINEYKARHIPFKGKSHILYKFISMFKIMVLMLNNLAYSLNITKTYLPDQFLILFGNPLRII